MKQLIGADSEQRAEQAIEQTAGRLFLETEENGKATRRHLRSESPQLDKQGSAEANNPADLSSKTADLSSKTADLDPETADICFIGICHNGNKSPDAQLQLSKRLSKDESERGPYEELPRKYYLRDQCEFTSATAKFLERYRTRYTPLQTRNGSQVFYIPIHGITNRQLQGNDSSEPKYFKSIMEITVPYGAHNLDQCTFRRGPRQTESEYEYLHGIYEELKGAGDLSAHQGPLCFFTHGAFTGAGVSDNDALRLALLSGVPTINIDWRSTQGPWYTLPLRYPVDFAGATTQAKAFESFLDRSFAFIGENNGAMVGFSRGTAFNAAYMQHRFANRELTPPINANILAHADLQTSLFKVRENGLNPVLAASQNTIVLGNPHDRALRIGRWRITGDRIGDAEASDISTINDAGGTYVIDPYKRRGGNFNHYIDYTLIAYMVKTMVVDRNLSGRAWDRRIVAPPTMRPHSELR